MNHAPPVAIVWLAWLLVSAFASACARETQARPVTAPTTALASPSPLALPDSAFRVDCAGEGSRPSSPSRFDTRRIGVTAEDGDGVISASKRFRGAPVDLDLKSADIANVFRLLADVGHVNIVVAGEITATITLRLKHVPWDQALDLVAHTHGLELQREGNIIVVRAGEPLRVSSAVHDDRR